VINYVRILRPINIFISSITILVCGSILDVLSQSSNIVFSIIVVGCFIGGANIFNDIKDYPEDKINRPNRPLPSGIISISSAELFYKILFLVGGVFCLFLPFSAQFIALLISFPLIIFYSTHLKSKPLIGNVVISLLLSLTFIFCGAVFGNATPMFIPSGLAFSLTFVRELIKDIEDIEGDRKSGHDTIPIKYGINRAAQLVILFSVITGVVSLIPFFLNIYSIFYLIPLVLGVELPLAIVVVLLMKSQSKTTARNASALLKIATIMGILSIYIGAIYGN
jgi:4-hydroxybenzoate polyprenyltransferase